MNPITPEHSQHLRQQQRQQLRQTRLALTPLQRQQAATQVCQKILDAGYLDLGQHFAFYCATAAELDPSPILEAAARLQKNCYLPVLANGSDAAMDFVAYREGDSLQPNNWGISEPVNSREKIKPEALDLVIVPLVGFDARCNRLGMGGGFYDRAFEFRNNSNQPRPRLVGVAFECQLVDTLEAMPWDVGMDVVVTEQEWRIAKR